MDDKPRIRVRGDYVHGPVTRSAFTKTIEENPKVRGNTRKLNKKDIMKIINFVKNNLQLLLDNRNHKIY